MFFLCLPFVPLIGYRHKGLKKETFIPIDCSRRLKYLENIEPSLRAVTGLVTGLVPLRGYWNQDFKSSFDFSMFILYLPLVPSICYWHQAHKKLHLAAPSLRYVAAFESCKLTICCWVKYCWAPTTLLHHHEQWYLQHPHRQKSV